MLFMTGRANKNVTPWYQDSGCLSIIRSVCSQAEVTEFEKQEFGKIAWIRNLIESKFLLVARQILDGRASADMALEEARKIVVAVSSASKNISQFGHSVAIDDHAPTDASR